MNIRDIIIVVVSLFCFDTSVTAQIDTKVTQGFKINGDGWNIYLRYDAPVTIFSYKKNGDIHSFGIYSDDYAGTIDMKSIPFDVQPKQLKKLPSSAKKKLDYYTGIACTKAREKALAGKYQTICPSSLLMSLTTGVYGPSQNDPLIIVGYKRVQEYFHYNYFYSIICKYGAGFFKSLDDKITFSNVPLPFLPSTGDPQVKAALERAANGIRERKLAEQKAEDERYRKLEEERKAQKKADEEKRLENLKLLDPAFIEINGWSMDSAGGIEVNISYTNCNRFKEVKYVYFKGYFLNAVGDKCRDEITRSTEWKATGVGPIRPIPKTPKYTNPHVAKYRFDSPKFYAKTAHSFQLSSVTIEYMDGKKTILSGDELDVRVDYSD